MSSDSKKKDFYCHTWWAIRGGGGGGGGYDKQNTHSSFWDCFNAKTFLPCVRVSKEVEGAGGTNAR